METYLVRIWTSGAPDAPRGDVRGFVERIGHGERTPFVGVEQLLARLAIKLPETPLRPAMVEAEGEAQ